MMVAANRKQVLALGSLCLGWLCFFSASLAQSQPVRESLRYDVAFSNHVHRNFDKSDGLPSEYINDLTQTDDGYVWIATNEGLARFDGYSFRVFDRRNSNLPSNIIQVVFQDSQGILWIGTSGGIARCDPSTNRFVTIEELIGAGGFSICEDREGRIWVGTKQSLYCSTDGETFERSVEVPAAATALCEDDLGILWIGTDEGLYLRKTNGDLERFDHELFPPPHQADWIPTINAVFALLPNPSGGIFVGCRKGLLSLKDGRLEYFGKGIKRNGVRDILQTRNGGITVASVWGIYRSNDGQEFELVKDQRYCNCLLEDNEGGLMVGRIHKLGLDYYRHGVGETLLSDQYVHCVFEDTSNNIWLGTRDDGLYRVSPDGIQQQFGKDEGLPDWRVYSIAKGTGDEFLVATRKGIVRWNGDRFSASDLPTELAKMHVINCHLDQTGGLWFSTGNGRTYRVRDGKLLEIPELGKSGARWYFEPRPGTVWVGGEFGILSFNGNRAEEINDPDLSDITSFHFNTKHVSTDGSLWLGTESGIARYKSGKFRTFTAKDGLTQESIDRIVVDSNRNLWIGGLDGTFLVTSDKLDRYASGQISKLTCRQLGVSQLVASQFSPNTLLASDGSVWITSLSGVLRIPASRPINPVPPRAKIEQIVLDNNPITGLSKFRFTSGRRRLSIEFGAVSFSDPENVRVLYRLHGYESDWVEADRRRSADYTDLRPGDYRFVVTAINEDGIPAESEQVIAFTVAPRWFETVWFRIVAVLSMVGFSILTTLIYSRSVRRRNEELQKEIDDRKLAERQLQQSEIRFLDLAESTDAIPFEANADQLDFTFVGDQCVEILGYAASDWYTEDFWVQHLHPEDRIYAIERYEIARSNGGSQQFDCRMTANDGTVRWIHNVMQFIDSNDPSSRVVGFMIDFTKQRDAEQKAETYLHQLERVNRAASLGEMATSIAHEVNQPLFAIVSNAETVKRILEKEDPDIAEIRDAMNDIIEDGNRASTIIKNIRSHVRKERQPTESLDIGNVASDALRLIDPELRRRELVLVKELAEDLPEFQGTSIEIQQVILNLVLNAAQAMKTSPNRELIVRTSLEDDHLVLQIIDHGIGLDPETSRHLFEPFFTTKSSGTGMGLAINKTIIEAHHGKIWASANSDGGATFQFALPVCREVWK